MILIREERPEDILAVRMVNELAFGGPQEARIVESLRRHCPELLSLVALEGGEKIVGHILFSPAVIESEQSVLRGMGLAPLAVVPDRQRRGIGSAMVERGLALLKERPCPFVIVLGHPEYYPRFGFEVASSRGIRSQWRGIPDEAFMILVLDQATMKGITGVARYRREFDRDTSSFVARSSIRPGDLLA